MWKGESEKVEKWKKEGMEEGRRGGIKKEEIRRRWEGKYGKSIGEARNG